MPCTEIESGAQPEAKDVDRPTGFFKADDLRGGQTVLARFIDLACGTGVHIQPTLACAKPPRRALLLPQFRD
jgi:hypothetical protein